MTSVLKRNKGKSPSDLFTSVLFEENTGQIAGTCSPERAVAPVGPPPSPGYLQVSITGVEVEGVRGSTSFDQAAFTECGYQDRRRHLPQTSLQPQCARERIAVEGPYGLRIVTHTRFQSVAKDPDIETENGRRRKIQILRALSKHRQARKATSPRAGVSQCLSYLITT